MIKKQYEEPTISIVEVEQCASLLQASGEVDVTMDGTFEEESI